MPQPSSKFFAATTTCDYISECEPHNLIPITVPLHKEKPGSRRFQNSTDNMNKNGVKCGLTLLNTSAHG